MAVLGLWPDSNISRLRTRGTESDIRRLRPYNRRRVIGGLFEELAEVLQALKGSSGEVLDKRRQKMFPI
jgi:hypothetical protein